jgi:hypothetical protein
MKFIISENKIDNVIYRFIDKEMKSLKGRWYPFWDDDRETSINTAFRYFSTIRGEDDDPIFEYLTSDYEDLDYNYLWIDWDLKRKFDNIFGDRWYEIFKKWFRDNFPDNPFEKTNFD